MKYSSILSASLLLTTVFAVYPPPPNIDTADSDLVTIQNSTPDSTYDNTNNPNGYSIKSSSSKTEIIGSTLKDTDNNNNDDDDDDDDLDHSAETLSPFYSFYLSISMIIVSEIGDKTFLIAAIMAMRHPRMVVFSAASSALILMTILSGAIGHVLPQLLSPTVTRAAAAILFIVFGINLLREGLSVDKDQGVEEELAEVEEEIAAVELHELSSNLEKGEVEEGKTIEKITWKIRMKNLISYVSSPIWFQTFSMTFLGEWGDRSQITTIAMAAGGDWIMIILGGCVGHALCTLLAVVAGQFVSTKISLRTILFGGAFAFFIFSGLYGYSAIYE
ncbi:hypothetical protein C6P40_002002 [Pichia californica]|uniref:GDT1 family protein n=1 Tax=Pichia californica TaxID=460514 RepID=A0A9P7BFI0_9ASCO|nr:hypothetical protein C6P42_002038 [[Candida] californica]KAG0687679.1 hypothetical protein C6P40_002002 [[Candida] californica]